MKNIIKNCAIVSAVVAILVFVTSCEEDFRDVKSGVLTNIEFSTNELVLDVEVLPKTIDKVRADGLDLITTPFFGLQAQYLLGVYNNDNYETIEASIASQITINTATTINSYSNPDTLDFVTQIDTVFLRLPYQATLTEDNTYEIDSVIGNPNLPFTLNVYELDTYLSTLNPLEPSKTNTFYSSDTYQTKPAKLNYTENLDFAPSLKDTLLIIKRKNSIGDLFDTDTINYTFNSTQSYPMAVIPLKKDFAKRVFLDNYQMPNFASQDAFNNYFRGIYIEAKEKNHASGDVGGSLIGFNLRSNSSAGLTGRVELYYTNTYFKANSTEIDTVIKQNHSFQLGGIINSKYNMSEKTYNNTNDVVLQGLAGSEAIVKILEPTKLQELKDRNLLINDASLTFYVNQQADTTIVPFRLYLFKNNTDANGDTTFGQITDINTEGEVSLGGGLELDNGKKDRYRFRITDYVSNLLNGNSTYNPPLGLKVFNITDVPITSVDTAFVRYNWNPKAVSILNGDATLNGNRRAQLKISYSEKND